VPPRPNASPSPPVSASGGCNAEGTAHGLREQCRIGDVTLKKGESTDVAFDSDVSVTITPKR
jgi:hypothetical protein